MRFDLHIHSKYSKDSNTSIDTILERSEKKGLDGIAITDHGEVKGALKALEKSKNYNLEVIPGIEVTTEKGDVLGLWVKEKIESKNVEDVINKIHNLGGLAIVAHPFSSSIMGRNSMGKSSLDFDFDGIEVYNSRNTSEMNNKALKMAKENNLTMTAGSDAHFPEEIGRCVTLIDNNLKKGIKEGKTEVKSENINSLYTFKNLLKRLLSKVKRSL